MTTRSTSALMVLVLFASPLHAATMDALAKKLSRGVDMLENKKIAVLSFPYHDEKISSASTLLSERLTTCLVERKGIRVLERRLIEELLHERKLSETGVIDPKTLKTLGTLLDADAIVTGTLIDLPDGKTELNARLIRIDSGEVLSAGQATVKRTWDDLPVTVRPAFPLTGASMCNANDKSAPVKTSERPESIEPPWVPARLSPSGKSLRLSNENFPPHRRHYVTREPPAAKRFGPASVIGFIGLPDFDEMRMFAPDPSSQFSK